MSMVKWETQRSGSTIDISGLIFNGGSSSSTLWDVVASKGISSGNIIGKL